MITNTRCVHCGRESYSKTSPRACANCGQNFDVPSRPGVLATGLAATRVAS